MANYQVRIDACFLYELEADSAAAAQANAETQFENGQFENNRITETLVFEEDGFTIAEDAEDEPCPINRRPKGTCPDACDHGEG